MSDAPPPSRPAPPPDHPPAGPPAAPAPTVRLNERRHRYEVLLGDQVAGFVTYRDAPGTRALVHTEVPPEFGGRGLAAALIGAALDDLRAQGLGLVPLCPYVRAYLERHPEQADLVAAGGTA